MPVVEGVKRNDETMLRLGKNGVLIREDNYEFTVIADDIYQEKLEIFGTEGLPRWGVAYGVTGLTMRSQKAQRSDEDPLRWTVSCTLSSEVEDSPNRDPDNTGNPDPTSWRPVASVRFEPYTETVSYDFSDPARAMRNSANDFFSEGLEITRRIAVVPFSQFEPITTTIDDFLYRSDTINSEDYRGKGPYSLLLSVENATIGNYNGFRCWRVDYVLRHKGSGWLTRILDHGAFFYDSADKKQAFYRGQWENGTYDPNGEKDEPFDGLLDGMGKALANQKTGTPWYRTFQNYYQIDFNSFLRVLFTS